MADQETTTATTEADKPKTVLADMDSRKLFDTIEAATAYIEQCQKEFADFGDHPVAAAGFTDDGDFDPAVYTDDMRIAVAVLSERGEGAGKSTVKAIVIYPSPKLEVILNSASAREWLESVMAKELNHVAVRNIRKAKNAGEIADAIESIPTTVDEFTTSSREVSSGILETYNDLWQIVKKAMGKKSKAFALANLSKKELRKAMESASYAAAMYPALETRTNKKGDAESLFEIAATFGQMLATQNGKDAAIFDRALANRAEKQIDLADDDEEDFDLEAMAAAIKATPADESSEGEATETGTETPAATE